MPNISKKKLLHRKLSSLYSIIYKRKAIVFDACTNFHLQHFLLVISELVKKNDFDIYVIAEESSNLLPEGVTIVSKGQQLPLHRKYTAFITTEMARTIYWLDCPNIYFGHGIGPKLNYVASEALKVFDYIFSPCKPVYDVQKRFIKNKNHIFKVGLPILEEAPKTQIKSQLGINTEKKIILYAPSWCKDIDYVSDIDKITKYLSTISQHSNVAIIISPHPLLFLPERCSGKIFFESIEAEENIYINKPDSLHSTLELVGISDVIISDISSILFEAMVLNKAVVFDGNKEIYDYSEALPWFYAVSNVCITPDWDNLSDNAIQNVLDHDLLADARKEFIKDYTFNIGRASEIFINHIYDIESDQNPRNNKAS